MKDDILHNLDFSDFDTSVDCVKGKLTTKTKKRRLKKVNRFWSLTYTNICAPFTLATVGGYKYFIMFIDNFSYDSHVELLIEKSESLYAFQAFKVNVEFQKVKVVRSYKDGEYYGRYDETGYNPGSLVRYLMECRK